MPTASFFVHALVSRAAPLSTTTTTMPLTHIQRVAVCWYWLFVLTPAMQAALPKERLLPHRLDLQAMLMSNRWTQEITRFTADEIHMLAHDLLINPDALITSNWRFSPLHRLVLALIWLSNALPSRKHSLNVGWASNAVLNNARYHIDAIIEHLGADGAGQRLCSSVRLLDSTLTPRACCS